MKNLLREFQYQIFRSWKQTIKFLLVLFIPTIYAGLFILAFWNPIANIGKIPLAIMDQSDRVAVVYENDHNTIKVVCDKDAKPFVQNATGANSYDEAKSKNQIYLYSFDGNQPSATLIKKDDYHNYNLKANYISLSDVVLKLLHPNGMTDESDILRTKQDRNLASKTSWSTPKVKLGDKSVQFDDIHYFYGKEAEEKYTSSDYPIQLKITNDDTMRDFYFLSKILDDIKKIKTEDADKIIALIKKGDILGALDALKSAGVDIINTIRDLLNLNVPKPLNIFGTYSHNFIVGYFIENISKFKLSIFSAILSAAVEKAAAPSDKDSIPVYILKNLWPSIERKLHKIDDLIDINFDREEPYGLYGYGIGEFFICIAITIAILAQAMLYKRSPVSKHKNAISYFFTKYALMLTTSWLQATIMCLLFAMTPFNAIGVAAMFTFWAWLLVFDVAMVGAMCFIMLAFRDDVASKFGMTFWLLLNLTSGNGTFPTYMQFRIFQWIGHITIFQPIIKGLGIIFYQISTTSGVGLTKTDSLNMLGYFGLLILLAFIAFGLGIFAASKRYKEKLYGTHSSKEVHNALVALGREDDAHNFDKKNHLGFKNWKSLFNDGDGDKQLKEFVLQSYPFENKHRWFKENFDK